RCRPTKSQNLGAPLLRRFQRGRHRAGIESLCGDRRPRAAPGGGLVTPRTGAAVVNPERWQAVGELFEQALSLPAGERTACIDRESRDDDELRQEVLSLLASHKSAPGGFVQEKIKNAVLSFH